MTRQFYLAEQPDEEVFNILVVFDNRYFWKASFGSEDTGLENYATGRITDPVHTTDGFREVTEDEFWDGTGARSSFIRWALSAYDVHLTSMSLTPSADKSQN